MTEGLPGRVALLALGAWTAACRPAPTARPTARGPAGPEIALRDVFAPVWRQYPKRFQWCQGVEALLYLGQAEGKERVPSLWIWRPGSGARLLVAPGDLAAPGGLTESQRAALERRRVGPSGITGFRGDHACRRVLLDAGGRTYLLDTASGRSRLLFSHGEQAATLSPDGRLVSFVRDRELYVLDLAAGREQRLTRAEGDGVSWGLAEFVAAEEFRRFRGHWWSPDGRKLAFTRVDESRVPVVLRPEFGPLSVRVIRQRYPRAGGRNAQVELWVADLVTGRQCRVARVGEDYLVRVAWTSRGLVYQVLSRDQKRLSVRLWRGCSRPNELLLREESRTYVRVSDDFFDLGDRGFVWTSEASGAKRIFVVSWSGRRRPVPVGREQVVRVLGAEGGLLVAAVSKDLGRQQQLLAVDLETGRRRWLTRRSGWHRGVLHPGGRLLVDEWSDLLAMPRVRILRLSGLQATPVAGSLGRAPGKSRPSFSWPRVRMTRFPAADGTPLAGLFLLPPGGIRGRHPAIVSTYGGPGGQVAARRWRPSIFWHAYMASRGFVVFLFDGRGTGHRGKGFEEHLYRAFGKTDVADVVAALRYVRNRPFVDPGRIGLWGWSYGGFLTLATLLSTGRLLAAGAAVAPVTDWRLYDTAYTERYLGRPDEDPGPYATANLVHLAPRLSTRLLLVHGMADDNVLLQHTLAMAQALQEAGKQFELMFYPGKRHGLRGEATRLHVLRTLACFFERWLRPVGNRPDCAQPGRWPPASAGRRRAGGRFGSHWGRVSRRKAR